MGDENNEDEEEMVCGSKKKRAHPEMSTPPVAASIPLGMSPSPATASPVETSTPSAAASISPGTSPSLAVTSSVETPSPLATLAPFCSCHTRVWHLALLFWLHLLRGCHRVEASMDPMHEHALRDAWQKRVLLQYKD
ncbi:hypothetical protein M9H77_01758 [Catharanthus roseus]|uniref:Uncharacterized protein n=1 Tax=Catharanthus roseus TaxID=4058 RepID=A0ACC0C6W2_CATRO|nr:hypothetical protein M9H77_01758 [Catharanthus roseus]